MVYEVLHYNVWGELASSESTYPVCVMYSVALYTWWITYMSVEWGRSNKICGKNFWSTHESPSVHMNKSCKTMLSNERVMGYVMNIELPILQKGLIIHITF